MGRKRRYKIKETPYLPIIEQPCKLRLYLNDPTIQAKLEKGLPIPLTLKGKLIVAIGENQKLHIIFLNEKAKFMPVFLDLEDIKLTFPLELTKMTNKEVK